MRMVLSRLERATGLDGLDNKIMGLVQSALPRQWMRDLLHGTWLGHPLHSAMVDAPLGAFTSSVLLDTVPRFRRAATALLAVGAASSVPTIIAGLNDWASLTPSQRRVGLVHAASNAVSIGLFTGSLAVRMAGWHRLGRQLSWAGISAAGAGAYLGGHLVYKMGAAVNQSAPEVQHIEEGWHGVARIDELPPAVLTSRSVNGVPLVLYHDGGGNGATAMLEHCGHQGGPLSEGRLATVDGHVSVECPWHGSTFRLEDGEVVHGPCATDQQTLPTRVTGEMLEVRLP